LEQKRAQEVRLKNLEIKDITASLDQETKRLNNAIVKKDQHIQHIG
jgi:hypothetical protein